MRLRGLRGFVAFCYFLCCWIFIYGFLYLICLQMFKGLKNKLEDEAKRLSATASQYAANMANQVRSGAVSCVSILAFYI